jgi:hypothetical protein
MPSTPLSWLVVLIVVGAVMLGAAAWLAFCALCLIRGPWLFIRQQWWDLRGGRLGFEVGPRNG